MNVSRKVTTSSFLVGLGFMVAHLIFDAVEQDDFRVFVVGLLLIVVALAIGVIVGLYQVGFTRLIALLRRRRNKELQSWNERNSS